MNHIVKFKVQPRVMFVLSLGMWLFGWFAVYKMWTDPEPLIKQSLGHPIIDFLLAFAVLGFSLVFGPIAALLSSYAVQVEGNQIAVRQWLGWRRRSYSITEFDRYSIKPGTGAQKLSMHFTDGTSVTVDSFANNYDRLLRYLNEVERR